MEKGLETLDWEDRDKRREKKIIIYNNNNNNNNNNNLTRHNRNIDEISVHPYFSIQLY